MSSHKSLPRLTAYALAGALCFPAGLAWGQTAGGNTAQGQQHQAAPSPQIDGVVLAVLIKSSIAAVQHANATGNYSVLRDLGTPIFRERYDQVKLATIFADLRNRGVNLSAALLLMPSLSKQPELTPQGQLHVIGFFPSQPLQIQYEMLFVQLDGIWRLDGIALNAAPADKAAAAPAAAAPEPAASAKAKPAAKGAK